MAAQQKTERTWTIYGLRDPGEAVIRYVGQTKRTLHERLRGHRRKCHSRRLAAWLDELAAVGQQPEIIPLAHCDSPRLACIVERDWIASLSFVFGDQLLNFDHRGDFVLLWDLEQNAILESRRIRSEEWHRRWEERRRLWREKPKPKTYTHGGETLSMAQWAERIGVSRQRLHQRLQACERHGFHFSEALSTPPGQTMPSLVGVAPWSRKKQLAS